MNEKKADRIYKLFYWFKVIVIMAILMLIYEYSANAQTTILGKVVDASTEEPLIGASVTYTAGKGTITDIDGSTL